MTSDKKARAVGNTLTHALLSEHCRGEELALPVGLIAMGEEEAKNVFLTAEAMGIQRFPVPCAVFASAWGDFDLMLSAAKKFGVRLISDGAAAGEAYLREQLAVAGETVLGTQYFPCGALGSLSVVDDEGAVLRTLLGAPYAAPKAGAVAVHLRGKLRRGVGPVDVALAILKALKNSDMVWGKVLEVFGSGLGDLSMDSRFAIDAWLRRTGCFSTLWATDGKTKEYLEAHGRGEGFTPFAPAEPAYYECGIAVDLSRIEPMMAVWPQIFTVREALEDPSICGLPLKAGKLFFSDFSVGGAGGTYETFAEAAEILRTRPLSVGLRLSVSPASAAVGKALIENGYAAALLSAGATFGGGGNCVEGLSASDGRTVAGSVILDARTLAYTAACGGELASAQDLAYNRRLKKYIFDGRVYAAGVFSAAPDPTAELDHAHGTPPLPAMPPLSEALSLKIVSVHSSPQDVDGLEEGATTENEDTMSAFAVLYTDHAEGAEWGQAIELGARGYRAVLAKVFSEKLATHLADWGILPLIVEKADLRAGDEVRLEGLSEILSGGGTRIAAKVVSGSKRRDIVLALPALSEAERGYILCGSRVAAVRSAH